MKLSTRERRRRQRTIITLLARGYQTRDIAEILGFSTRTIYREVRNIEASEDEELMRFTLQACKRAMTRREYELRKCAWELFNKKETTTQQKIAMLNFFIKLDSHALKLFKSVGILRKIRETDEEASFEGLSTAELRRIGSEMLEELSRMDAGNEFPHTGNVHETDNEL
jgi:transposase